MCCRASNKGALDCNGHVIWVADQSWDDREDNGGGGGDWKSPLTSSEMVTDNQTRRRRGWEKQKVDGNLGFQWSNFVQRQWEGQLLKTEVVWTLETVYQTKEFKLRNSIAE